MITRKSIGLSNVGHIRTNNEDNLLFDGYILESNNVGTDAWLMNRFGYLEKKVFGVFDGMGGHENGEIASYIAAKCFKDFNCSSKDVQGELLTRCMLANETISGEKEANNSNMGTTVAVAVLWGSRLYCLNVGDSCIFLVSNGSIKQLSEEHSEKKLFADMGSLPPNRKFKLTQYLGLPPSAFQIEPFICETSLHSDDRVILCSDGLTDMVSTSDMLQILNESSNQEEAAKHLLDAALEAGGRDNITFIIIDA